MTSENPEVAWSPELSVGVDRLDDQHRKIIDTLNELLAVADPTVDSEVVSDTLAALTQYASEHFADEERLMEMAGYPELEEHKKEHQVFRRKTAQCCVAVTMGVGTAPCELAIYLSEWVTRHVVQMDLKYKPYLAAAGLH